MFSRIPKRSPDGREDTTSDGEVNASGAFGGSGLHPRSGSIAASSRDGMEFSRSRSASVSHLFCGRIAPHVALHTSGKGLVPPIANHQ